MDCEEFFDTSAGDADGGAGGGGGEAEESAYSLQQQIDDYQHTLGDAASSCFLLCVYIEEENVTFNCYSAYMYIAICIKK